MKKIASITVTHNDWNQIQNWEKYFRLYEKAVDYHIIVDNNSDIKFKKLISLTFPNSTILFRESNGGVTAAFNDGINYCLEKLDVGFIMLICPDISIDTDSVLFGANKLENEDDLGVLAPILFDRDGKVELYGGEISRFYSPIYHYNNYEGSLNLLPSEIDSPFLPGGINISKVSTYLEVGLQDENLFMYGDEVDWMIRVRKKGFRSVSVTGAKAYHYHINFGNDIYRSDLSYFLINRNTILLAWKYSGFFSVLLVFLYLINKKFYQLLGMIKRKRFKKAYSSFQGLIYGLFNIYSIPKKII
jgi:GT2 family glycosyltransferase